MNDEVIKKSSYTPENGIHLSLDKIRIFELDEYNRFYGRPYISIESKFEFDFTVDNFLKVFEIRLSTIRNFNLLLNKCTNEKNIASWIANNEYDIKCFISRYEETLEYLNLKNLNRFINANEEVLKYLNKHEDEGNSFTQLMARCNADWFFFPTTLLNIKKLLAGVSLDRLLNEGDEFFLNTRMECSNDDFVYPNINNTVENYFNYSYASLFILQQTYSIVESINKGSNQPTPFQELNKAAKIIVESRQKKFRLNDDFAVRKNTYANFYKSDYYPNGC